MRLFLDICQGLGLSAAAGIRPFLPALVLGVFASFDALIDFDGTDYAFLERAWFLGLILALMVITFLLQRRLGAEAVENGPLASALAGIGIALGALFFAGALADDGYTAWPGLIAGGATAAFASAAVRNLWVRVRARLDEEARRALIVYEDGSALLSAVLAILIPPVSILFLGLLGWLLAGGRRRSAEKYAGLRILR